MLTFHGFKHLNLSILLNEFSCIHVTTADSNNQSSIDDLSHDISFTELVLSIASSDDFDCQVGLIYMLGKSLIYDITGYWLVQFDLLELEDLFSQVGVLLLQLLSLLIERFQLFAEGFDSRLEGCVHFQHTDQVLFCRL